MRPFEDLKIAVAVTGYVGLSIATLLSQHHTVTAVDIIPGKVELINKRKSPIQDEYIEKYLVEKELDLTAILLSAMADTACRKIRSSCWQTTRMFPKILSRRLWKAIGQGKTLSQTGCLS